MTGLLRYSLFFVLYILAQALLFSILDLPDLYMWPKIFPVYVLTLPFILPRWAEFLIAFAMGVLVDWTLQLPLGGSSFSLVTLVAVRKYWIMLISQQGNKEFFQALRLDRESLSWLLTYLLPMVFFYELVYYITIDFGIGLYTLLKILGSGTASVFWVSVLVILTNRRSKRE
ncbi:MAG: hypothetical protein KF690_01215 [Bacteroidetes bacterium]|nr:hypothetical protein [Bacteroidota bacterium]